MLLGSAGIEWFRYEPEFGGNREFEEGRLALECRRLTNRELLLQDDSDEAITKWRDNFLESYDGESAQTIKEMVAPLVLLFRRWVTCTRAFENFEIRPGYCSNDPVEIFFELPLTPDAMQGKEENLTMEILRAISHATSLQGDELKKYVAAFGGNTGGTGSSNPGREKGKQTASDASAGSSSDTGDSEENAATTSEMKEQST